jgi:hypothetical protein
MRGELGIRIALGAAACHVHTAVLRQPAVMV